MTVACRPGSEGHYEFDQELRLKLAATRRRAAEEGEEEGARNLMNRLMDPGPEARENGVAGGRVSVSGVSEPERELLASTSSEGGGKERSKSKKIGWAKKREYREKDLPSKGHLSIYSSAPY